jgi:hypothetical protein
MLDEVLNEAHRYAGSLGVFALKLCAGARTDVILTGEQKGDVMPQFDAAPLLIVAVLSAASPASAGLDRSATTVPAPEPRVIGVPGDRVQAPPKISPKISAESAGAPTTVLDINGSGEIRLHNRLLAGGLILYMAVMLGALIFLDKRRVAATVILATGLIVGGLLLAKAVG